MDPWNTWEWIHGKPGKNLGMDPWKTREWIHGNPGENPTNGSLGKPPKSRGISGIPGNSWEFSLGKSRKVGPRNSAPKWEFKENSRIFWSHSRFFAGKSWREHSRDLFSRGNSGARGKNPKGKPRETAKSRELRRLQRGCGEKGGNLGEGRELQREFPGIPSLTVGGEVEHHGCGGAGAALIPLVPALPVIPGLSRAYPVFPTFSRFLPGFSRARPGAPPPPPRGRPGQEGVVRNDVRAACEECARAEQLWSSG